MSDYTPQINAILDQLVSLAAKAISASQALDSSRVSALTESLATNGWERHREDQAIPLGDLVKARLRRDYAEPAIHRGAEIDGVIRQIEHSYERHSRDKKTPMN